MSAIAAPLGIFIHSDTIMCVEISSRMSNITYMNVHYRLPNENTNKDSKLVDLSVSKAPAPDIEIFFAPLIVVNNGFTKTPGFNGLTIVSH